MVVKEQGNIAWPLEGGAWGDQCGSGHKTLKLPLA